MPAQNILIKLTNESLGWLSAAEGFVFLSGLTAGLVYTYKFLEKGENIIKKAARNRAWLIYKYHILLFILIAALVFLNSFLRQHSSANYYFILENPPLAALLAPLLLYQPKFLDILPMYAVFVLFIPLIIRQFEKGSYAPVLLTSGALYLLGTFNVLPSVSAFFARMGWHVETGLFDLLCWQLLFVLGLYLGSLYYHERTAHLQRNKLLFYAALAFAIPVFIAKFFYLPLGGFDIQYWADKTYLRPFRLVNFFCVLIIITYVATKFKNWFHYRPICTLGKYSLEVFAFHIVLLILLTPVEDYLNDLYVIEISNRFNFYPLGTLLIVAVLFALFLVPAVMAKKTVRPAKAKELA